MAANIDKRAAGDGCELDQANNTNLQTQGIINNHICVKQPIIRKIKPIPPPLDLSKHGPLEETNYRDLPTCFSASPKSPSSANQKHLPFRKR